MKLSIVIPAHNEAPGLARLLPDLRERLPQAEIIVVDDGSTDDTANVAGRLGAMVLRHPYCKGNGAAVKSGARAAAGEVILFMDGDGQHRAEDAPKLLALIDEGYDMVVGARSMAGQASLARHLGNFAYNRLASWMTGHRITDLTSGFRAVRTILFRNFLYLLPNGFSYPATSTIAFFRCGYSVGYVPIEASARVGTSKLRVVRDGVRFLLIIMRVGALFSPMRFFLPISLTLAVVATSYYAYTYTSFNRFTNMSALLYVSSLLTFLFGIISEQVSALHYRYSENRRRVTDQR